MRPSQDSFSESFWSPAASTEPIPNYTTGLNVLHDKLSKSVLENEAIATYLQKRIDAENACADLLTSELSPSIQTASDAVDTTMNASLKSSFDMVCHESVETAHCHRVRAGVLAQDVLEPLSKFTRSFRDTISTKKKKLEEDILEFEHAAQSALMTRSVYWSRCRALELACPDFRPPVPSGFQEEEDDDDDENEDGDDIRDAAFVGGRQRSSSVASELNVDRGGVRLGRCTVLPYQDVARSMNRMQKMIEGTKPSATSPRRFLGKHIFEWIRDYCATPPSTSQQHDVTLDTESQEICKHLVALKFLRCVPKEKSGFDLEQYYEVQQNVVDRYLRKTRIRRSVDNGQPEFNEAGGEVHNMTLEVPSSSPNGNSGSGATGVLNGFFERFKTHKEPAVTSGTKAHTDMVEADAAYKKKIKNVDKMRKKLEEKLFSHFDEMEQLEMDRIKTIKHAFITMSTSLNNTLPMFKETYNRITLFQETLKPEQDIHYIVEQFKTGPYCPRPMIYENYYHGSAIDQIFGVPLEDVAQIYVSYVPPIVNRGLKIIDAGLALKRGDELEKSVRDVWCHEMPIKELNKVCDELDNLAGSKLKSVLEKYDLNVLANIIRIYLLELPECLLTFDLYEPVKILYATPQDVESRLMSVSKLLTTLPSPNYHTLKALSHHLFKLLKQTNEGSLLNEIVAMFAYILMRPMATSTTNMHDRHPKRLIRDLLTHYDTIFTKDINKAQRSSASRSAIVADNASSTFLFVSPPMDDMPVVGNSDQPNTSSEQGANTESALRRTLLNIMRRNSAETGSRQHEDGPPDSPGGPPIVPHSKITLFEDPEKSEPTPKQSGTSTPQESIKNVPVLDDDDRIDAERLSTDVSLMLDMDDEDDAVEIRDKDDVERRRLTPTSERTPNRSRASTRGTMDNVNLDPFFDD